MWKDFQKILEKRVQNNAKTIENDKYVIIKSAGKVIEAFFGELGSEFIEIKDYKEGVLWIFFKNSTWRSEFKLQEKMITKKINQNLKQEIIKKIIIL